MVRGRTYSYLLWLALVSVCGCGVSGEPGSRGFAPADGSGSSGGQQVVVPVSGGADALPEDDFFSDDTPTPILGSDQFANFLSFLNDAFVAELLQDSPSTGGFESSMTYLERACIEDGTPEHICRQRYGN